MIVECLLEKLKTLPDTHSAIVAWGDKLKPGETLFAYREGDEEHDCVWIRADTAYSPDMTDSGMFDTRVSLFARSFNLQKGKKFIEAIISDWDGREMVCGDYVFLVRAESVEAYAFLLDALGRTTWTITFYIEGRRA